MHAETPRPYRKEGVKNGTAEKERIMNFSALKVSSEFLP